MDQSGESLEQIALDYACLRDRLANLEACRAKLDKEEELLRQAKGEVKHRTRTVREARWNLAFWQRQVESTKRPAEGQDDGG